MSDALLAALTTERGFTPQGRTLSDLDRETELAAYFARQRHARKSA